jgi:NAD(P)-dependent dehydrogenase (short-subunit alcohol dehydrogenase family)
MFATRVLEGQVAIVTGGGTGIGLAIARTLGRLGASVAIASRDEGHRTDGLAALGREGLTVRGVQVDVRDPAQVDAMVADVVEAYGRLDILINNAAGNFVCRAEDLSPNGWNAVVGIVLSGSFYCARAVGRHLMAAGHGGSIVSILANYVWTGSPGTVHSAAAKAGVLSLTQTLAVEWAPHQIRVNAVAPGPVDSAGAGRQLWASAETRERIGRSIPAGRWGTAQDIADAVSFLVSPYASFITGDVLTVDGGQWLGRGFDFLSTQPDREAQ